MTAAREHTMLSRAAGLKFRLLAEGVGLSPSAQAYIDARNGSRAMTPADYASTSGIILCLEDQEWVNAPITLYNSNFVENPSLLLDVEDDHLVVLGCGAPLPVQFWLPPAYHDTLNDAGEPLNSYAFTHGDRVRISPVEGCAMACQFCNLPYDFAYRTKRVEGLVESVEVALSDAVQPAGHILISGGTPRREDFDYLHECYEAVLTAFPEVPADIMMVPLPGLLDVPELVRLGVTELSINIEIFDSALSRRIMRAKSDLGQREYLDFIEGAADALGPGRVRSMLLVGVEPVESTLKGVAAIAAAGGVPVLSPFRPDPGTPMRDHVLSSAAELSEVYLRAVDIAGEHGTVLGPRCGPCSHNTITLVGAEGADSVCHLHPRMV
jgi:hypothetical protein